MYADKATLGRRQEVTLLAVVLPVCQTHSTESAHCMYQPLSLWTVSAIGLTQDIIGATGWHNTQVLSKSPACAGRGMCQYKMQL